MTFYRANPQVIHETIEGETIIIDLSSGTYYSLQGTGPEIWNALVAGASASAIAEWLAQGCSDAPEPIAAAVDAFLRDLEAAGLVAPEERGDSAAHVSLNGRGGKGREPAFRVPKLETFTDMQEIILLDPVHQVDDRGWPHAAEVEAV